MGDLNLSPDEPPIELITQHMNDSRLQSSAAAQGPKGTVNGFRGKTEDRRID